MSTEQPAAAWDEGRLGVVLSNGYEAFGRRGRVDAIAAAAEFGVSPSTVRRWVRNGLPARRRSEIQAKTLPSSEMRAQERRELLHARESLWDIAGRGAPINSSWTEQGWLKPHLLVVVLLRHRGVCVVRLARADSLRAEERFTAGGGEVVEEIEFRNRFRAQVAKGELLEAVDDWRIIIPTGSLRPGRTQAWIADAPRPTLEWLRDHPHVKIPVTRPRKPKATP